MRIRSIGGGKKVVIFIAKLNRPDLEMLGELVESGRVKPVIDRRYDVTRSAEALGYLDESTRWERLPSRSAHEHGCEAYAADQGVLLLL